MTYYVRSAYGLLDDMPPCGRTAPCTAPRLACSTSSPHGVASLEGRGRRHRAPRGACIVLHAFRASAWWHSQWRAENWQGTRTRTRGRWHWPRWRRVAACTGPLAAELSGARALGPERLSHGSQVIDMVGVRARRGPRPAERFLDLASRPFTRFRWRGTRNVAVRGVGE